MRRLVGVLLLLGLVVVSCGGESDDGPALASAIADGMMEGADADSPFDRADAECFGGEVVERMGVDRLVAVGLSLEDVQSGADPGSVDLSSDDVDQMTDALTACVDFGRLVVDSMVADLTISDSSADCLVAGINEANFLRAFAESSLLDAEIDPSLEGEMTSALFAMIADCLTPEELQGLGG